MSVLSLPTPAVIVLAGPSGIGKSTWARRLFPETMIVSSDYMRALITDDESNQDVNAAAFSLVHTIAKARLAAGRPVVIDSTALVARDRAPLVELALEAEVPAVLIVFTGDERTCMTGQRGRGREVPLKVVQRHLARLQQTVSDLAANKVIEVEGFEQALLLDRDAADAITAIEWVSSSAEAVDVISDVHGCVSELQMLLTALGYEHTQGRWVHPQGRIAVFVGDLTDRGPNSLAVLELVDAMLAAGSAQMGAMGNHDWKLYRHSVLGRDVKLGHGLDKTVREIDNAIASGAYRQDQIEALLRRIYDHAPAASVFDAGRLVVTHGAVESGSEGLRPSRGRRDRHSTLALYGQTTGEMHADGKPVRIYEWVNTWNNPDKTVIFGHDVVGREVVKMGPHENVWAIDTGCAFGGRLTAVRWPEREIVQVDALGRYAEHDKID